MGKRLRKKTVIPRCHSDAAICGFVRQHLRKSPWVDPSACLMTPLVTTCPGANNMLYAGCWCAWVPPGYGLACWFLAIRHLSLEWTINEQYQYGWIVPALTVGGIAGIAVA